MKLSKLSQALSLKEIVGGPEREVTGVYVGDLLSRAMSHVRADALWITIMANANTVAVASLTDAAAVLLCEDVSLPDDAKKAAEENGIIVLSSGLSAYELCGKLAVLLG